MRTFTVPAVFVLALALGPAAFAAAGQATHVLPAATSTEHTATPSPAERTESRINLLAACEKNWSEQKQHKIEHKAFMDACVKKG